MNVRWQSFCFNKHRRGNIEMPEGPTIRNMADRLRDALLGQPIIKIASRYKKAKTENWAEKIEGQRVVAVRSHGKNLFIELSNGYSIYSHMLMWGSWHIYAPDEEWAKEERLSRLVLHTPDKVVVLFNAPICEVIAPEDLTQHRTALMGPDVLSPNFDPAEVWRRFITPENRDKPLGEVIMDQYVIAGIGNILKSEILFQAGLNPLRPAGSLTPEEFDRFIQVSREILERAYQTKGFRNAFLSPELRASTNKLGYVYMGSRRPCFVCGTPIQMVRQGAGNRMTFYCPTCQPLEGGGKLLRERQSRAAAS
jgi:endonuclease-8